jgi:hypothetical protein
VRILISPIICWRELEHNELIIIDEKARESVLLRVDAAAAAPLSSGSNSQVAAKLCWSSICFAHMTSLASDNK